MFFDRKNQYPMSQLKIIDKELGRLEKLGVIEKTDNSPTVYIKE